VYNSATTIGPLVERLIEVLESPLQVVLVDDASSDGSRAVCLELCERHPEFVTYLELSRNFGEHNAVMAGLNCADGDHVVIMDDDFQNPPEEVPRLIACAVAGNHDVVYTRYPQKRHSRLRNLGSSFNDLVATLLLSKPRGLYLSSFKCLSRFAVRELISYRGPYPYVDGLVLRSTRRIGVVAVEHHARPSGHSGYTARKLVRLWLNMFLNFSIVPLRLSLVLGFTVSAVGFLFGLLVVWERLYRPDYPIGWAALMVGVVTFSGIQLVILGIIGEYLGQLFLSSNRTPQYIVREIHGNTGGHRD
jgi:glycosyltransferase involved in cell wall biosynthesis